MKLKKNLGSDRVAIVEYHTGLIALFFARLLNTVTLRRFTSSHDSVLSPDDVRVLERIAGEWYPKGLGRSRSTHEIIERALCQLQRELDSGHEDEITEDLRREIEYRLWCGSVPHER
jgi:hypothetical protein